MNFTRPIRGLTAIFYLNEFTSTNNNYLNTDVKLSQSSGIGLSVHASETQSFVEVGEKIDSETENLVHISQISHMRLPELYGTCTDRLHFNSPNTEEGDDEYTIDSCYNLCMQQMIIDHCGCLDTEFPFNRFHLKQLQPDIFYLNGSHLHDLNVLLEMEQVNYFN